MNEFQSFKEETRRRARQLRKDAASTEPNASTPAAQIFLKSIVVEPLTCIALYRPIKTELDPTPLVQALQERGAITCFPVVTAPDTPLQFRVANPQTHFIPGAFGAEIPEEGSPVVLPTIVVAPLLAWDRNFYRLGYGGGFYDRTLEMLRKQRPTLAYGYAYTAQEMESVPIEETDQQLDGVVTEAKFFQ